MDPDLTYNNVSRTLSFYLGGRGPDMFWEVAQPRGSRTIGLEDGLVAE